MKKSMTMKVARCVQAHTCCTCAHGRCMIFLDLSVLWARLFSEKGFIVSLESVCIGACIQSSLRRYWSKSNVQLMKLCQIVPWWCLCGSKSCQSSSFLSYQSRKCHGITRVANYAIACSIGTYSRAWTSPSFVIVFFFCLLTSFSKLSQSINEASFLIEVSTSFSYIGKYAKKSGYIFRRFHLLVDPSFKTPADI